MVVSLCSRFTYRCTEAFPVCSPDWCCIRQRFEKTVVEAQASYAFKTDRTSLQIQECRLPA